MPTSFEAQSMQLRQTVSQLEGANAHKAALLRDGVATIADVLANLATAIDLLPSTGEARRQLVQASARLSHWVERADR